MSDFEHEGSSILQLSNLTMPYPLKSLKQLKLLCLLIVNLLTLKHAPTQISQKSDNTFNPENFSYLTNDVVQHDCSSFCMSECCLVVLLLSFRKIDLD